MEKALLIGSAVLLVAYFIFTETLDWVGRIGVIRQYIPKFPEFLERRLFRVVLLFVAIALLIRVAVEHKGDQPQQIAQVQKIDNLSPQPKATDLAQVPQTPPSSNVTESSGTTDSLNVHVHHAPKDAVTAKVEHKPRAALENDVPPVKVPTPQIPSQSCPNGICIGGENSGTATVNNFGAQLMEIKFSAESVTSTKPDLYETKVIISTSVGYTPVSLAIMCDASVQPEVTFDFGPNGMALFSPSSGTAREDDKIAWVKFGGTAISEDSPLYVHLWSKQPLHVLRVVQARIRPPS